MFIPSSVHWVPRCRANRSSLAYCELYVTLGRLFRHFDDLKTPKKSKAELVYNDYFSSYHPEEYNKFIFQRSS